MKEYRILAVRPIYKIGKDALVSTIEQELNYIVPQFFIDIISLRRNSHLARFFN
jgi:hypothetical protein